MSPQPADLVQHVPDAPADPAGDAQWAVTARQSLAHADARLCRRFEQGDNIERLLALRTRCVDQLIQQAWRD